MRYFIGFMLLVLTGLSFANHVKVGDPKGAFHRHMLVECAAKTKVAEFKTVSPTLTVTPEPPSQTFTPTPSS